MDGMEFFQLSAGKWRSQRTTHHLAFRRAETGESEIDVATLEADHPQVVEICRLHQVEPSKAAGGALVSWQGTMAWDRSEEENHTGSTVMVIVPDPDNPRQGSLLRERGYAEIVPVAGRYLIDDQDALVLLTEYETMSSEERFCFVNSDVRMRTSTVKRFGGFSTASLCVETRIGSDLDDERRETLVPQQAQDVLAVRQFQSTLGW
ncbi:phycobiliprotein lyase [Microcoleus sp. ZQ-A2]|jgi:hypothetical protein|nr:phycobiliprotein lyase [Microcoleus sp. FACHB-1]